MKIRGVKKNSPAAALGIQKGGEILSLGGHIMTDILDYEFYDASEAFSLAVKTEAGEIKEYEVKKEWDEPFGLSLVGDGIKLKTCRNKCIFCFVDQQPKDYALRPTLRIKDDDYRHSFLYGTYVTLTNLTDFDIARIKRIRLSPLYVSVHTTDEPLRRKMLGLPCVSVGASQPRSVLSLIKEFYEAGIGLHAQIVYCPGFNEDIEGSTRELAPYCESLAIVPVGLTKYQNPMCRAVTKSDAERVIALIEKMQSEFLKQKGTRFVWAADELYLKAEEEFPALETYEDYPQIENGVGLFSKFNEDFEYGLEATKGGSRNAAKKKAASKSNRSPVISMATGVSAYPFIRDKAQILSQKLGLTIHVYPVENHFFGSSVTVAGLLTGGDLVRELKNKPLGEKLLLPSVMFREGGEEFLDNMTLSELSKELNITVEKTLSDGESFVYAVAGIKKEELI